MAETQRVPTAMLSIAARPLTMQDHLDRRSRSAIGINDSELRIGPNFIVIDGFELAASSQVSYGVGVMIIESDPSHQTQVTIFG